jgi:hypothetical protein
MTGLNASGKLAFSFALANGEDGMAIWSPTSVPGDYNGDSVVDTLDYTEWQKRFGSSAPNADGNVDGIVDAADYVLWRKLSAGGGGLGAFEASANSDSQSVPEPSTMLVMITVFTIVVAARSAIRSSSPGWR